MSAPDSFGTPGWDSLRVRGVPQVPNLGPLRGPHAAAVAEMVRRQAVEAAAREEAAIRTALTLRIKTAMMQAIGDGDFGDASGHLGTDGFDALAKAAVDALEQFYNDGRKAMQ